MLFATPDHEDAISVILGVTIESEAGITKEIDDSLGEGGEWNPIAPSKLSYCGVVRDHWTNYLRPSDSTQR